MYISLYKVFFFIVIEANLITINTIQKGDCFNKLLYYNNTVGALKAQGAPM